MQIPTWRDGRLSWPSWLTYSGEFTDRVVTCQSKLRRRAGKVCRPETNVLTTELCHPAPLKLRPYGAIQICLLLLLLLLSESQHLYGNTPPMKAMTFTRQQDARSNGLQHNIKRLVRTERWRVYGAQTLLRQHLHCLQKTQILSKTNPSPRNFYAGGWFGIMVRAMVT